MTVLSVKMSAAYILFGVYLVGFILGLQIPCASRVLNQLSNTPNVIPITLTYIGPPASYVSLIAPIDSDVKPSTELDLTVNPTKDLTMSINTHLHYSMQSNNEIHKYHSGTMSLHQSQMDYKHDKNTMYHHLREMCLSPDWIKNLYNNNKCHLINWESLTNY